MTNKLTQQLGQLACILIATAFGFWIKPSYTPMPQGIALPSKPAAELAKLRPSIEPVSTAYVSVELNADVAQDDAKELLEHYVQGILEKNGSDGFMVDVFGVAHSSDESMDKYILRGNTVLLLRRNNEH